MNDLVRQLRSHLAWSPWWQANVSRIVLVTVFFLLLPYLARVPAALAGDARWLRQYVDVSWQGWLLFQFFAAIPLVPALLSMRLFQRHALWLLPVLPGAAYVGWWHARLDLASDAQAAIGLFAIPLFSLECFSYGAALAAAIALIRRLHERRRPPSPAPEDCRSDVLPW